MKLPNQTLYCEIAAQYRRVDRQLRITSAIRGKHPIDYWCQRWVQLIIRQVVCAHRNARRARIVSEKGAIRDSAAGKVSIRNDEA